MNTSITQKLYLRAALQIIAVLVAIPQVVRAGEPADLSRFNVQSCVSEEVRESTAQQYLKSIDVPQYPRQFLSNLKFALEHDWLLQEDFYTVDNIRQLLGASEVQVKCSENNQFLPSFTTTKPRPAPIKAPQTLTQRHLLVPTFPKVFFMTRLSA